MKDKFKPAEGYEDIFVIPNIKNLKDIDKAFSEMKIHINRDVNKSNSQVKKQKLLNDFSEFCKEYLPNKFKDNEDFVEFHPVQLAFVNAVLNHQIGNKYQLRMPRAWGKSTLLIALLIFLLLRNELRCLAYIGKIHERSAKQLKSLGEELLTNEKIINDFGTFDVKSTFGDLIIKNKEMGINCSFEAFGLCSNIRGTLYSTPDGNYRPALIFDDCDDDDICRNPERLKKTFEWFKSEALPCISRVDRLNRVMASGNRFADSMIITEMEKMPSCQTFTLAALDATDHSTWEIRFPTPIILAQRSDDGPLMFNKEMMHIPASTSEIFPVEYLQFASPEINQFGRTVAYFDSSNSIHGDYKSIVIISIVDSAYYVWDCYVRKGHRETALFWLAEKYKILQQNSIPLICYYDSTFNQSELINISLRAVEKEVGFNLPMIPKDEKQNKIAKIEMLQPYWFRRKIFFNKMLEGGMDFIEAKNELMTWTPVDSTTHKHDDFLDSLISCILLQPIGYNSQLSFDPFSNKNHY